MSDFAEYVEKQQAKRYPSSKPAAPVAKSDPVEHHEELDILDSLNLGDSEPSVSLRDLLLAPADDAAAQQKLSDHITQRLLEGHNEAVFDLGFENNGDSMRFTLGQWNVALDRLKQTAKSVGADCDVLLTKNLGGEVEAESTAAGNQSKDTDCTGKILIRRAPSSIEDVIETRIAVVGNGKLIEFVRLLGTSCAC